MIFPVLPGPNPQEYDAKFSEFLNRAEDDPSRAGRLSKTFPDVPIIFRVSCGNPESRQGMVLGLGMANVGRSKAARCFRIVKFSRI